MKCMLTCQNFNLNYDKESIIKMNRLYRWNIRDSLYLVLLAILLGAIHAVPRFYIDPDDFFGSYVSELIGRMFLGLIPLWATGYVFLESNLFDSYTREDRRSYANYEAIFALCFLYILELFWLFIFSSDDSALTLDFATVTIFIAALHLRFREIIAVGVFAYIVRGGIIIFFAEDFNYIEPFWSYYEPNALIIPSTVLLGILTKYVIQHYLNRKPSIWIGFPSAFIIVGIYMFVLWSNWDFIDFVDVGLNYSIPLVLSIGLGTGVLILMYRSASSWKAEEALEVAKERYITNQIKPHFLYNTLGIVQAEIDSNPQLASELLQHLSDMYRRITQQRHLIPLSEELEHVQDYLFIVKTGMEDRLTSSFKISPDVDISVLVPILSLQPIVENAVTYGIEPKTEGGIIEIKVENQRENITVIIRDDGPGMGFSHSSRPSTGVGFQNVSQRWQREFGRDYIPEIESELGEGTTVKFRIPR